MFQLIFQSQFEEGATYGTIALDDVEILYSPCPETTESSTAQMSEAPVSSSVVTTTQSIPTTDESRETTTEDDLSSMTEDLPSSIEEHSFNINSIDEHPLILS